MSVDVEILDTVPMLAALGPDQRASLATVMSTVHWEAGTTMVEQGTEGDACWFLLKGEAEVRIGEAVVAVIGPGQPVGEVAAMLGRPRTATVVTTTPVDALELHAADVAARPELARELGRLLLQRADDAGAT